ncbi:stage II sporulation protein D [Pullulanibacillus sp. KACC 23026]|uniref:stage II sporulation protein D n=1 Tax=Pullulanibacillus sp. KACC 23026 TaxID=3028315 RepID=UPI0023B1B1F1|nr:stage II sporulation protein D [Pullulanibacillus sp. KACC 23026]WEG13119.1 stage II sporulation protein D [Pullulanibacillus sp. KACC 23026]
MKKRYPVIIVAVLLLTILILPSLIVLNVHKGEGKQEAVKAPKVKSANKAEDNPIAVETAALPVTVYRSSSGTVDDLTLHDYLVGVVACEMPANFKMEALKAQALAARTYVVDRLLTDSSSAKVPKGVKANVIDTTDDQVYKSPQQLKELWGSAYASKIKRIEEAVTATEGEVITYKGKIIGYPAFFSTSNGYTENANEYYETSIPYLKSVPSKWDLKSPKYKTTISLTVSNVEAALGVSLDSTNGAIGEVKKWTTGKRIADIEISGHEFTGREVREKLNLRSADFVMKREGNEVQITTYGYGHGVGMSQYGANGMAQEGKTYKQIVQYYYSGSSVSNMATELAQIKEKL